mmetsp:Transcript_124757/g.216314  ORF Transcript_124757/g.216314 Transcript_124757/m.216314 type:complete len:218 (-) Transcript_124757:165-818(-)
MSAFAKVVGAHHQNHQVNGSILLQDPNKSLARTANNVPDTGVAELSNHRLCGVANQATDTYLTRCTTHVQRLRQRISVRFISKAICTETGSQAVAITQYPASPRHASCFWREAASLWCEVPDGILNIGDPVQLHCHRARQSHHAVAVLCWHRHLARDPAGHLGAAAGAHAPWCTSRVRSQIVHFHLHCWRSSTRVWRGGNADPAERYGAAHGGRVGR